MAFKHLIPLATRCTAAPYCSHNNACGVVTIVIITPVRHLWNCNGRLRRAVPRATHIMCMHCNVDAMQCFAVFGCWVMPMLLECVIPWLSCACTLYRQFFTSPSFSVSRNSVTNTSLPCEISLQLILRAYTNAFLNAKPHKHMVARKVKASK